MKKSLNLLLTVCLSVVIVESFNLICSSNLFFMFLFIVVFIIDHIFLESPLY